MYILVQCSYRRDQLITTYPGWLSITYIHSNPMMYVLLVALIYYLVYTYQRCAIIPEGTTMILSLYYGNTNYLFVLFVLLRNTTVLYLSRVLLLLLLQLLLLLLLFDAWCHGETILAYLTQEVHVFFYLLFFWFLVRPLQEYRVCMQGRYDRQLYTNIKTQQYICLLGKRADPVWYVMPYHRVGPISKVGNLLALSGCTGWLAGWLSKFVIRMYQYCIRWTTTYIKLYVYG